MPEAAPSSSAAVLKYPAAMVVVGLAMLFAVATSRDLGQPLAGILTAAGGLAALGGAGLILAWVAYRRRSPSDDR